MFVYLYQQKKQIIMKVFRVELINGANKVVKTIEVRGENENAVRSHVINNELKYTRANCFRITEC